MLLAKRLEPCGEVYGVPVHGVALATAAAHVAGNQRSRIYAGTYSDPLAGKLALRDACKDCSGCLDGIRWVLRVGNGQLEGGEHGITLELRDEHIPGPGSVESGGDQGVKLRRLPPEGSWESLGGCF